MLKFLTIVLLFLAYPAFAGPSITGGGKGVVCRNADDSVRSVELLDLWEAENLFNRKISRSEASVEDQVKEAVQRMKDIKVGGFDDPAMIEAVAEATVSMIQEGTDVFFGKPWPRMTIQHLHGVTLTLSQDSFEDARPADCAVEQIVLYKLDGSTFYINDDLFGMLPKTDQAALIVHEAFYSLMELRGMKATTPSSVHSRRAVGYVFSGGKFDALPDLNKPHVTCQADFDGVPMDVVSFSLDPQSKKILSAVIYGYPGESPMGYFPALIKSFTQAAGKMGTLLTNQECKGQRDGVPFPVAQTKGAGPVDFDRNGALVGICKKGKFEPYWSPDGVSPIPQGAIKHLSCKSRG